MSALLHSLQSSTAASDYIAEHDEAFRGLIVGVTGWSGPGFVGPVPPMAIYVRPEMVRFWKVSDLPAAHHPWVAKVPHGVTPNVVMSALYGPANLLRYVVEMHQHLVEAQAFEDGYLYGKSIEKVMQAARKLESGLAGFAELHSVPVSIADVAFAQAALDVFRLDLIEMVERLQREEEDEPAWYTHLIADSESVYLRDFDVRNLLILDDEMKKAPLVVWVYEKLKPDVALALFFADNAVSQRALAALMQVVLMAKYAAANGGYVNSAAGTRNDRLGQRALSILNEAMKAWWDSDFSEGFA